MGWLIALAIICFLLFLPLGFSAVYRQSGLGVWLVIGPVRYRVYPSSKKKNVQKGKSADNSSADTKKGGKYRDFFPVVRTILEFLEEFRRKICVRQLELKLILAGDDPSDLAVNYGKAWAALGSLTPHLERFFVIKKRDIEVECDFMAEETLVYARIDATMSVVKTLHLLFRHGLRGFKRLLELKKLRKGGAQL